jgi:NTE family protein
VSINGRRYIDGGIRSAANADLAAGCDRVIIIAPHASGFGPLATPGNQARALSEAGAQVTVIKPDKAALRAIGRNVLDPARRPAAALAGCAQAGSVAHQAKAIWCG